MPNANNQRMTLLTLAALGIVSVFLPWLHLPTIGTVNGMENDRGILVLTFFCLALIFGFLPGQGAMKTVFVGLCGVAATGLAIYYIIIYQNLIHEMRAAGDPAERAVGVGIYLAVAFGAGIVAVTLWSLATKGNNSMHDLDA